jgi:CRISPR-associated RAMP protein (TIGR02581 family)
MSSFFLDLRNRYVLECTLHAERALHVGAGAGGPETDAPFILQNGQAFLPGSSLRGVFRSTIERIVCTLAGPGVFCTSPYEHVATCHSGKTSKEQEDLLAGRALQFCPMCQFFGSTGVAAKFKVSDALLACAGPVPTPERRDGVGIDRDTETARDKIKFDYEALAPGCDFKFFMHLENADDPDFALLYILLRELHGGFHVGGKKARGLGRATLTSYTVGYFDNTGDYKLRAFLTAGALKDKPAADFETWLKPKFNVTFPEVS